MLRVITENQIDDLLAHATESPRKRAIYRLHEHHEPVQRMVNALVPGTYVTPHKHENPDKMELFAILRGRLACLHFDPNGTVANVVILDANGANRVVDIPPRTYHSIIALEPSAALEIIQGPYDAATHKQFAPWAPVEDDSTSTAYLADLTRMIVEWPTNDS